MSFGCTSIAIHCIMYSINLTKRYISFLFFPLRTIPKLSLYSAMHKFVHSTYLHLQKQYLQTVLHIPALKQYDQSHFPEKFFVNAQKTAFDYSNSLLWKQDQYMSIIHTLFLILPLFFSYVTLFYTFQSHTDALCLFYHS